MGELEAVIREVAKKPGLRDKPPRFVNERLGRRRHSCVLYKTEKKFDGELLVSEEGEVWWET